MGMFDFLYTPKLSAEDRERVDDLRDFFRDLSHAFNRLRNNEEIVIRVSIEPRRKRT